MNLYSLALLAMLPLAALAEQSLEQLKERESAVHAAALKAEMQLMQAMFEANEAPFSDKRNLCLADSMARYEEIADSNDDATYALAEGNTLHRDKVDASDLATAIFIRNRMAERFGSAQDRLKECLAQADR